MPKEKFGEKVFKIEWFSMGLLRRRTCKFYQVSQQDVFKVSFIRVLSCAFGFQKAFLQTNVWITLSCDLMGFELELFMNKLCILKMNSPTCTWIYHVCNFLYCSEIFYIFLSFYAVI